MMQGMIAPLGMRGFARCLVLTRHPPARDLDRLRRASDVVDDQDIAGKTLHLGRDVGIVLVDIEAVCAARVSLDEADQLGLRLVADVVDAEAAVRIDQPVAGTGLDLGIHHHEVTDDAHLVRMRPRMRCHELADNHRVAWIGNVDDRGAVGSMLVPDIGIAPLDDDLATTGQLHARKMADVVGGKGRSPGAHTRSRRNCNHVRSSNRSTRARPAG